MIRFKLSFLITCCLLLSLAPGCAAPWHAVHEGDGWTLYSQKEGEIEIDRFETVLDTGREVVEQHFGPFDDQIRVYAWAGSARNEDGTRGTIQRDDEAVEEVPGIGPARVQAFYAKRSGFFGGESGVYLGEPDAGTTIHELVHAKLAERAIAMPLWLEEGLAMVLGDGAMFDGEWQVDGLACWPLRELSEESLNDAQLELLLSLEPGVAHDMRTNVLVHFLGWSIVFDLYRESGRLDWERWNERYSKGISVTEARRRMDRTLSQGCVREWLKRLENPDPAVRLATVKGIWKLHSREVATQLMNALRKEEHPEVAVSLMVNALATAGDVYVGRRNKGRMRYMVRRILRDPQVEDPKERAALRTLYEDYFYDQNSDGSRQAIEDLARFLEE